MNTINGLRGVAEGIQSLFSHTVNTIRGSFGALRESIIQLFSGKEKNDIPHHTLSVEQNNAGIKFHNFAGAHKFFTPESYEVLVSTREAAIDEANATLERLDSQHTELLRQGLKTNSSPEKRILREKMENIRQEMRAVRIEKEKWEEMGENRNTSLESTKSIL